MSSETRVEIVRLMEKIFLSSRAIDKESLCVAAGKLVWSITIEVSIQSYDGNLVDSTFLAALFCLSYIRLPQIRITGTEITINHEKSKPINV